MKAAGVNPVDTYMRQGVNGYNPQVPIILGKEAAGEVESVGVEVKEYKVRLFLFIWLILNINSQSSFS